MRQTGAVKAGLKLAGDEKRVTPCGMTLLHISINKMILAI